MRVRIPSLPALGPLEHASLFYDASSVDCVGLKNVGRIVPNQARLTAAVEKAREARKALAQYLPEGDY